ncbi:MAG: NAD(P)-dependent oxidoreductase, partial [Xanthomonadales bacterium]|nr:NAD(P)-dependent oxidoreductase [Xanthomonadales bacterium]
MKTGVIGLGAMGAPMARHLHAAGLLEAVWNRTADKAAQLAQELGVAQAASPADLAARVDVVLTCVSADDDLLDVVAAMHPALRDGQVLVDTSTVSPLTAQRLAEELGPLGVGVVDAPVSGGVEGARQGRLSVMAGGETRHIERVRPMLDAFSQRVTHMGPVGSGQATKAVNQVLVAGIA